MNVSEKFVSLLKKLGITEIFIYPGGTIAPILNACVKHQVKIHNFKSEQGAGFAAIGAYKISKKPQVVMVTSGPGVTNIVTPLADAFYDSVPLIIVTGQVGTKDLESRLNVRQRGFQEVPTIELVKKISKKSFLLKNIDNFEKKINEVFKISYEGRPGPVVIDFPMNIQRQSFHQKQVKFKKKKKKKNTKNLFIYQNNLNNINQIISRSTKRLLLLGNGATDKINLGLIKILIKKYNFQVVTSLLGLGSYDTSNSNFVGYIGHTGHVAANYAAFTCNCILVLGSRLDLRQTGTEVKDFCPEAKKIMVDIDKQELKSPRVKIDYKINQDVNTFLKDFLKLSKPEYIKEVDKNWIVSLVSKKDLDEEDRYKKLKFTDPKILIRKISKKFKKINHSVVTGVGIHQQWVARHYSFNDKNFFLTSGGHGTMGFDLPSSIGASINSKAAVICFVGDGSIMMNLQELKTISEKKLNIKIIILNNSRLGIVSQFQLITFGKDPTTNKFQTPDFKQLAKSFNIKYSLINKTSGIDAKIKKINSDKKPELIEVIIDHKLDVSPMLLAGYKMNEMWYSNQ